MQPRISLADFRHKQVIILRADLEMSRGKAVAQACHASVSAAEKTKKAQTSWWRNWFKEGQRKIVLRVSSESELLEMDKKAKKSGIPASLISDMGLTELKPGTATALGIGPAPSGVIDKISANLPLY